MLLYLAIRSSQVNPLIALDAFAVTSGGSSEHKVSEVVVHAFGSWYLAIIVEQQELDVF